MKLETTARLMACRLVWLASCLASTAMAADLVVIGNPAASPLSKDQIADIFLGKDQSHAPVDLPESSPLRAEF